MTKMGTDRIKMEAFLVFYKNNRHLILQVQKLLLSVQSQKNFVIKALRYHHMIQLKT